MPLYLYRCADCAAEGETWQQINDDPRVDCPECDQPTLNRVYSFQPTPIMHEHFNPTVGKVVSDPKQFVNELRRKSDEMSERTGMTHNYVPVDLADSDGLNVTDEGMDSTMRRQTEQGKREVKKWL